MHREDESYVATDGIAELQAWRFVAMSGVAMHTVVELWTAMLAGVATDMAADPQVW